MKVKRALISVYDKTGLVKLARDLRKYQIELFSTGNTAKILKKNEIPVITVTEYTKSGEILGGRVKTLHPLIFGAILAQREKPQDKLTLKKLGIKPIDLVIVNLYPFEKMKEKKKILLKEMLEYIDIGGSSLIRAAAKNFSWVGVITHPRQYPLLIEELEKNQGSLSREFLFSLAQEAFATSAHYDFVISEYLSRKESPGEKALPNWIFLNLEKTQDLRYGENPHQKGALFRLVDNIPGAPQAKQIQGKELSFNNFLDINAAWEALTEFEKPTAVIIKHTNPCGLASAPTLREAYCQALAGDPLSAYGGVVGLNRQVDEETAKALNETKFLEVIIAPGFSPAAINMLKEKEKRRLIEISALSQVKRKIAWDYRTIIGGFLIQDKDWFQIKPEDLKIVTQAQPSREELSSLLFAWRVVKRVKSNAIVIAQGEKTLGVGAGQMSRVDAVKIAIMKLKEKQIDRERPLVLASDAFFPFRDAIDEAAKIGIRAIIQPGGSIRDQEVIQACNEYGISMVFTGVRCFRH